MYTVFFAAEYTYFYFIDESVNKDFCCAKNKMHP